MRSPVNSIGYLYLLLGKTEQTYYYNLRREAKEKQMQEDIIQEVRSISVGRSRVGVPKLRYLLKQTLQSLTAFLAEIAFMTSYVSIRFLLPERADKGPRQLILITGFIVIPI